jgi:hypothetical protein
MLLALNNVLAESLEPNEVVRVFVKSLQNNDIQNISDTADIVRIASNSRHSMNSNQLVDTFKEIDVDKINFQERDSKEWPSTLTVSMLEPISYDFNLEWKKATIEKQEDHYVVVSVHP